MQTWGWVGEMEGGEHNRPQGVRASQWGGVSRGEETDQKVPCPEPQKFTLPWAGRWELVSLPREPLLCPPTAERGKGQGPHRQPPRLPPAQSRHLPQKTPAGGPSFLSLAFGEGG